MYVYDVLDANVLSDVYEAVERIFRRNLMYLNDLLCNAKFRNKSNDIFDFT